MIRSVLSLAGAGLFVAATSGAPLQCSRSPDPELRREDTAGDALWDLAQELKKKGKDDAAKEALRFLVERYPSNRHVPAARAELGEAPKDE